MQILPDKYKPYGSALALILMPFLLWYLFQPAKATAQQYQDSGVVIYKIQEHPKGTDQWKCVIAVDNPVGKRLKLYTSEEVFNRYHDGDTIAFRCPQSKVTKAARDL